jgi:hypothetical protein
VALALIAACQGRTTADFDRKKVSSVGVTRPFRPPHTTHSMLPVDVRRDLSNALHTGYPATAWYLLADPTPHATCRSSRRPSLSAAKTDNALSFPIVLSVPEC